MADACETLTRPGVLRHGHTPNGVLLVPFSAMAVDWASSSSALASSSYSSSAKAVTVLQDVLVGRGHGGNFWLCPRFGVARAAYWLLAVDLCFVR